MDSVLINNTKSTKGFFINADCQSTIPFYWPWKPETWLGCISRIQLCNREINRSSFPFPHFRWNHQLLCTPSSIWYYGKRPGGHLPGYALGLEANWDLTPLTCYSYPFQRPPIRATRLSDPSNRLEPVLLFMRPEAFKAEWHHPSKGFQWQASYRFVERLFGPYY